MQPTPGDDRGLERLESLDEMLSYIAHEIRNPLSVLQGYAGTIKDRARSMTPEELEAAARALEKSAKNLDILVTSLTDAKAISGDEIKLHLTDVLISELVEETMADLEPLTRGHQMSVHIEDDARVRLDVVRIRQVLTNLVSNAVKFSPRGTEVAVKVLRNEDRVEICIQDGGPGIPKDRLNELFHKFSRLGSQAKGTGLGLWVSRGIARAHGGDLTVGDGSNDGCLMVLSLPIHGEAAEGELPSDQQNLPR